jgi:hypothetical protein
MFARGLVILVMVLVGLGAVFAPALIDAGHWWPRKRRQI